MAWYGLTRASRRWPWLGVALSGFFGLLAAAGIWMIFNAPQSEGSPAGTIAVALGGVVAVVATGLAVWFGALGVQGVLWPGRAEVAPDEELGPNTNETTPLEAIVILGLGILLLGLAGWWFLRAKPQPVVSSGALVALTARVDCRQGGWCIAAPTISSAVPSPRPSVHP